MVSRPDGKTLRQAVKSDTTRTRFSMNEPGIVIVFGAGASYGAGHVLPEAPPLGENLYSALATQYPNEWGSGSQLGKWADKFRHDFEQTMFDEVMPRVPSLSLLEWHRPVAAFFARYRLDGSGHDMYSRLLAELKTKGLLGRLTLGSLNYECLLEQAAVKLGLATDYMLDDAHPAESIPLAKIHGSSNFVTEDLFSWRPYLTNAGSLTESPFTVLPFHGLEDALQRKFSTYEPAYFPVLGMYSQHKPSIVAPGKLSRLRNILRQRIVDANVLVLIGLRPSSDRDPHLWEPVASSRASKIGYVGGTDHYEILKEHQGKAIHLAETFEEGFTAVLSMLSS